MTKALAQNIVIKAPTEPEVQEICEQFAHLATFGDIFPNRYEGGYACKGRLNEPADYGEAESVEALAAQLRQSAATIGRLQEQVEKLKAELEATERYERNRRCWEALDTRQELADIQMRRIDRRNGPEHGGISGEELERRALAGWHWGEPVPPAKEEKSDGSHP